MGQGQSNGKSKEDVSMYPEDIQRTHQKVVAMREKLALLKAEGKANKKKRKKEMKALEKEKMELHVTLMKLGKHAQRHFTFWEYVRIIRATFNSTAAKPKIQQGAAAAQDTSKPNVRTMVKQSDAVQYTIFAFYEAYLLKKLHVAMMLKTQKKLHAKGWNDMTMFLYYEIPKIQTSFEKAEAKILNQQQEEEGHREHVEGLYQAHIENQKSLMVALQDAVQGKVRVAPKGAEYSFRKKKSFGDSDENASRGSSGSFRSKENSSSRSIDSSGAGSGSFQQKQVRSSMFGPAYESGSAKKEAYQAPWMKNSRNKFAKASEKAKAPIEEEEEEKPAPAPAPGTSARTGFQSKFSKFRKKEETEDEEEAPPFQSRFKKFQATKEEEPEPEPEPEPDVKEEEPEPEPALPSDDEVEINEPEPEPVKASSPEETEESTEFTARSSSAGEDGETPIKRKKKKKKNPLPDGIPETLEIDTSDDDMSLDGDAAPADGVVKKKKKKKKKKVAADGEAEESGEFVKKKKKKKKKVGVSSGSSVVSELSNGSNLPH